MKIKNKGKFKKKVQYEFDDIQTFIDYLASLLKVKNLGKKIQIGGVQLSESIIELSWEEIIQILYVVDLRYDWHTFIGILISDLQNSKFKTEESNLVTPAVDDLPF